MTVGLCSGVPQGVQADGGSAWRVSLQCRQLTLFCTYSTDGGPTSSDSRRQTAHGDPRQYRNTLRLQVDYFNDDNNNNNNYYYYYY